MIVGGGKANESNFELSSMEPEPKLVLHQHAVGAGESEDYNQKWQMLKSFGNSVGHSQRLCHKRQDSGIDLTSCKRAD